MMKKGKKEQKKMRNAKEKSYKLQSCKTFKFFMIL